VGRDHLWRGGMAVSVIRTVPIPHCPDCGAVMWLRRPRPDQEWDAFWGCNRYPHCHGVRHIQVDGTPEEDDPIEAYESDWL